VIYNRLKEGEFGRAADARPLRVCVCASHSQELEMMGGGDTRISKHKVVVRLRPPRAAFGRGSVWVEGANKVHVGQSKEKDGRGEASRVYTVTTALPAYASQLDLYNAVGVGAVDTLWDGKSQVDLRRY
jgi:hypothetical protein